MDATPGADIEDSRPAARLGELGGLVLAAIAVGMPGIGSIVAAGPLAAGLGEAAGHVAGGVASTLKAAGVPGPRADQIQEAVEHGSVLLAVHAAPDQVGAVRDALVSAEPLELDIANWNEGRIARPIVSSRRPNPRTSKPSPTGWFSARCRLFQLRHRYCSLATGTASATMTSVPFIADMSEIPEPRHSPECALPDWRGPVW